MLREHQSISQLASEHGVHPNVLHNWKAQALEGLPGLFEGRDSTASLREAHERAWRRPLRTGRRGRPRLVTKPGLLLGQAVK